MRYKYVIKPQASRNIWSFYRNVALKYSNTFSEEDLVNMHIPIDNDTITIHDACHQQNMHNK